jgi:hypothetical protein
VPKIWTSRWTMRWTPPHCPHGPDRPALVTQLLERCDDRGAAEDGGAFWWSRPVGLRIGALLRLVALTEATDSLGVVLRCVQADCGERFEVELPLHELIARAPDADAGDTPLRVDLPGGRSASLRLPTGNDLRDWATLPLAGCGGRDRRRHRLAAHRGRAPMRTR